MTQIGSSTPTYDANGNVTNDFLHTYTWDAAGRPVTVDGGSLTYDALGRMVENAGGGFYSQFVYGPIGAKIALMSGQTLVSAFVPLPGNARAVYNASGLSYYGHADWLGSQRFGSTTSRAMYSSTAYGPYGEVYAHSGSSAFSFTGQDQMTSGNLYDFPAREYGIQGRWPSPDPSGIAAASMSDPQTWNRYAYVRNSPLQAVDPQGLKPGYTCAAGEACASGEGADDNVTYVVDGVVMDGFSNGFISQMLSNGEIFRECPFDTCRVWSQQGGAANFYAYTDGTAGYETSEFVGYSPGTIVGTMLAIESALSANPINTLSDNQKDLVNRLATALGVQTGDLQVYSANGGNLFALAPSGSLVNLTSNTDFSSLGNSSIFHGLFSADSRENTPNGMYSLHVTMLDPSLVALIGGGTDSFLYIGFHEDLYNPNQNLFGHTCQFLKLCQ